MKRFYALVFVAVVLSARAALPQQPTQEQRARPKQTTEQLPRTPESSGPPQWRRASAPLRVRRLPVCIGT